MIDIGNGRLDNLAALKRALASGREAHGAVRADTLAGMATDALVLVHIGLAGRVLLHLAGAAAAPHAEVFHAAAKARLLMALEVGERDDDVGIHESVADLGLMHVLAVFDRNQGLVRALEAVRDDDVATGGIRGEAVLVRAIDMLKRVFAAAHVERVAVREEGLAAQPLDHVYHGARVIGTQEGQVAQLAKVDLDGNELVLRSRSALCRRA